MTKEQIRLRFREFINENNGDNAWKGYFGSELEEDIVSFVMRELKHCSTPDLAGQSEQFSMPHEFTDRDNFSGQCLICGKGKLFH